MLRDITGQYQAFIFLDCEIGRGGRCGDTFTAHALPPPLGLMSELGREWGQMAAVAQ